MKILVVSWYFPPVNTIGALRVGKFVRFLLERGVDVGVVAGSKWGHPETLPLGVPLKRVSYQVGFDINALPSEIAKRTKSFFPRHHHGETLAGQGAIDLHTPGGSSANWKRRVSNFYQDLTNVPDSHVGWFFDTYKAGLELCRDWTPDLVFASGPPFTALVAGQRLSQKLHVPWVPELRDRWADDAYDTAPRWRRAINDWLERRTLSSASALVTVTEPWAQFYRRKYTMPIETIYNGYDPLDYPETQDDGSIRVRDQVIIGYTGGIYPGRRDPTPLFKALSLLGDNSRRFRVIFCGTDPAHVFPLAAQAGVSSLVEVRPSVPYQESLAFQRDSDILLLMQWNDPREQGNCPGKFFEYIASLRPMLILGLKEGVPATIARAHGAGDCINDPHDIAAKLLEWLSEKERYGRVRGLPMAAREGLSRNIQYEKLLEFLRQILAPGHRYETIWRSGRRDGD